MRGRGTGIEQLRALADDHADIRDGAASREVRIVLRRPVEVIRADLLPAAIFTETSSPSR